MWEKIGEALLKTGEAIDVRRVRTPDHYHEHEIRSLLHYNKLWMWYLDLALGGKLDDLEARFYIGILNNNVVGNVSTWEYGPIGIVAHLYTARSYRKKGVCTALMRNMIQDFRNRGGKILIGGFRPASYPIAQSLGFKSVTDNSEVMHLEPNPYFVQDYFRAGKLSCRDLMWKDWPGVSLLFGVKEGWRLRSVKYKVFGPYDYEDYFLRDMWENQQESCKSKVLFTERGNVVGHAVLTFKYSQKGSFWLLDFFIHPASVSNIGIVLDALTIPAGKTRCYVGEDCREKLKALLDKGFREKGRKRFRLAGKPVDTILMER
jgi:predicted GNAT family acetyltransferase